MYQTLTIEMLLHTPSSDHTHGTWRESFTPGPRVKLSLNILTQTSKSVVRFITILFKAILRIKKYSSALKQAKVIVIPKPAKNPNVVFN